MKSFLFSLCLFIVCAGAKAEDPRREEWRKRVQQLPVQGLVQSILSVGWDLRAYDKYHCYYNPEQSPKACEFMETTSGQYEDFYWSTMSACKGSELCPDASLNISFFTYVGGDKRICADLKTKSCTKNSLSLPQMQEELIDLLIFKEDLDKPAEQK